MGRGLLGLVLMLWMFQCVNGNDSFNALMGDILSTFGLTSPTILYTGDEEPKICMTRKWVLCLNQDNDQMELAEHIVVLYKQRKQDSLFFIGTNKELLRHLEWLQPSMFRSNSPIFMPIELSNALGLKLDTNIIFYQKESAKYKMVDKFAVNGGTPITLNIASWDERDGLKLETRINRWDRRTDLMGATFLNTLWPNDDWAQFIYNDNGTIIGSEGWFQEKLFYVTDALNLTVTIREEVVFVEDKPVQVLCDTLLLMNLTDVCSAGMPHIVQPLADFAMPIATDIQAQTLLAGVPAGTAPDARVYVEVFGITHWLILLSLLLVVSLVSPFIDAVSKKGSQDIQRPSVYQGFIMASMFLIQLGSHPQNEPMAAKRMLALVTSMLTLLLFIYYSNDITAKMTAGSPPIPVRTFEDVLDREYKVISVGTYYYRILKNSKNGTAKRSVYQLYFEKDEEKIEQWQNQLNKEKQTETKEVASDGIKWWDWTQENLDWAEEQIMNDPKTLFYCYSGCVGTAVIEGTAVALDMDDTHFTFGGFLLRGDSEYLSVFNHYLLKAFETGTLQRLDKMVWNADSIPPKKIGLPEPEALGIKNVMFLFSCLGGTIIISLVIAIMENTASRIKLHVSKSAKGRLNPRRGIMKRRTWDEQGLDK